MSKILVANIKGDKGDPGDLTPELVAARDAAVAAKTAAETAAAAAMSVPLTNDGIMAGVARDTDSEFRAELNATIGDSISVSEPLLNVERYGVTDDPSVDNAASLQSAINAALAAGGGVMLPRGRVYRVDGALEISVPKMTSADFILDGNYGRLWAPASSTTDPMLTIRGVDAVKDQMGRGVRVCDLRITPNRLNPSSTGERRDREGVRIQAMQDVAFDNVWISGFTRGGLRLIDVYDSTFVNVQVLVCGTPNNSSGTVYYAVSLEGVLDQTNATHWVGLHVEQSALMFRMINGSRHNQFFGTKFEQGGGIHNATGMSPVYVSGYENEFIGFHFTQNDGDSTLPAFITTASYDETSTGTLRTAEKRAVLFSGGSLATPAAAAARWFTGSHAHFRDIIAQRTYGDATTYAFTLGSHVTIENLLVTMAAGHSGLFSVFGQNNRIRRVRGYFSDSGNSGAVLALGGEATDNRVEDVTWAGSPQAPLFASYGVNRNVVSFTPTVQIRSTATPSVFDARVLQFKQSSAVTVTDFTNGYYDQKFTLLNSGTANVIVTNNSSIVTGTGGNLTITPGTSRAFVNISGVWYAC